MVRFARMCQHRSEHIMEIETAINEFAMRHQSLSSMENITRGVGGLARGMARAGEY